MYISSDQGKLGAMFVSDDKALKYHLDQKQEVDLEKEYGIEHLVDSLEGDFYTFDMFVTSFSYVLLRLKGYTNPGQAAPYNTLFSGYNSLMRVPIALVK